MLRLELYDNQVFLCKKSMANAFQTISFKGVKSQIETLKLKKLYIVLPLTRLVIVEGM